MYEEAFCKVYNEFGWNCYPEAFGEELLEWLRDNRIEVGSCLDIGCGTGVLCEILTAHGIAAQGIDLSEHMIAIARERAPQIPYEAADMVTYRPKQAVDLVTCTGDALNHLPTVEQLEATIRNVCSYLKEDGWFLFDILNEKEAESFEPVEFDYSDTVRASLEIRREDGGVIRLIVKVRENGEPVCEETITEILYDPQMVCGLLRRAGFREVLLRDTLSGRPDAHSTTWFVLARK